MDDRKTERQKNRKTKNKGLLAMGDLLKLRSFATPEILSRFLVFLFLCFFVTCFSAYADKIFLKNGTVYEGKLVGRSHIRYLFAVDFAGEPLEMSFFLEDVEKIELGKDSVEEQIPYLKEVESFKVEVKEEEPKVYELSLYVKNQGMTTQEFFSESNIKKLLGQEECEYYERFNEILKRYADKFAAIQHTYLNLTTASKEDFASAKGYMDDLYFELNNIFVPEVFRGPHVAYLKSAQATFLAFSALEQNRLDEATKQIKISEESKQQAMLGFREIINSRKKMYKESPEQNSEATPSRSETQGN